MRLRVGALGATGGGCVLQRPALLLARQEVPSAHIRQLRHNLQVVSSPAGEARKISLTWKIRTVLRAVAPQGDGWRRLQAVDTQSEPLCPDLRGAQVTLSEARHLNHSDLQLHAPTMVCEHCGGLLRTNTFVCLCWCTAQSGDAVLAAPSAGSVSPGRAKLSLQRKETSEGRKEGNDASLLIGLPGLERKCAFILHLCCNNEAMLLEGSGIDCC